MTERLRVHPHHPTEGEVQLTALVPRGWKLGHREGKWPARATRFVAQPRVQTQLWECACSHCPTFPALGAWCLPQLALVLPLSWWEKAVDCLKGDPEPPKRGRKSRLRCAFRVIFYSPDFAQEMVGGHPALRSELAGVGEGARASSSLAHGPGPLLP